VADRYGLRLLYGIVGGDANQWQPNLFRNTTAIYPYNNNPGWNLITAMADDAIEYMRRTTAINTNQKRLGVIPQDAKMTP